MAKAKDSKPKNEGKRGGAANLKRFGHEKPAIPGPGASKGPRWATVIAKFMDAPAKKDFAELAREMGICGPKEKATMRMAMIARAVKTFMEGQEKAVVVGSGESQRLDTVNERAGDPRILVALMDREDGKATQMLGSDPENPIGFVVLPEAKE